VIVRLRSETAFRPFSAHEKARLIAEISVTYVRVRWLLRNRNFQVAADAVRAGVGREDGTPIPDDLKWFAVRLGNAVERNLERLPGDTRCLTRSLVLVRMLARRELRSTLVIGVLPAPSFAAHAWVEIDRQPLLSPIEFGAGRLGEF
jgi:hypothetical protein